MAINQTQADWKKTGLRLPQELHQQIHQAAREDDRTFNSQIVAFLRECISARQHKEAQHEKQDWKRKRLGSCSNRGVE